jgi:hypothetical protein
MHNFRQLWSAGGSYWAITSVGPPLADESCNGNFCQPPWPMEVTDFAVTFVGQVKPTEVTIGQTLTEISPKPMKIIIFCWLWANFYRPLADASFYFSYSARERKHIGSMWSRVTCLALPLAATQSLERRALRDSQCLQRLTIATINKHCKQINKQYLMTKQTVPIDATHRYEHVGARIT